eukprot:4485640-Prymnesium_polylepis.1
MTVTLKFGWHVLGVKIARFVEPAAAVSMMKIKSAVPLISRRKHAPDSGVVGLVSVLEDAAPFVRGCTMLKVHWVNIFFKAGPKLLRVVDGCDWDVGGASFE